MEQTVLDTIGRLPTCSVLYREAADGALIPERFSEELLRFLGYAPENAAVLYDKSLLQFVYPEDRKRIMRALDDGREDGAPHSAVLRLLIRNDGCKWVSAALTRFTFSEEKYLYILFTDIDDLKKQEAQLQSQFDAAQSFLDSVAGTYLMTDATLQSDAKQSRHTPQAGHAFGKLGGTQL